MASHLWKVANESCRTRRFNCCSQFLVSSMQGQLKWPSAKVRLRKLRPSKEVEQTDKYENFAPVSLVYSVSMMTMTSRPVA